MARYKDANFRKVIGHRTGPRGEAIAVTVYTYEGSSKIYDIVLDVEGWMYTCREKSKKCEPSAVHREIDKFFNLGLML